MIITSLLDVDIYKFYMMQVATDYFPNQVVEYEFKNRTKNILLKNYIKESELRKELDNISTLSINEKEINYLMSLGVFSNKFYNHIKNLTLDGYELDYSGKEISITVKGKWCDVILWETLILSVVNELYCKSRMDSEQNLGGVDQYDVANRYGLKKLYSKLSEFVYKPSIKFMDFGTRRRFSKDWQDKIVSVLKMNLDENQFIGTSNVYLAMKYNINPIGTNAHELYMFASGFFDDGTDESLVESQSKILDLWYSIYGEKLSIALTDTFGTNSFFKNFTKERMVKWNGFRHDSGDPFIFGDNLIKYLKENGINPMDKVIVFSDGLDINLICRLKLYFDNRINMIFGIGTNLTNDVGIPTISIVMKMTKIFKQNEVKHLIKLSDNLNKVTGDELVTERYKRAFNYINTQKSKLIV